MKKIKIFLFSFLFILVGVTAFTHNAYATASFSVSNCSISMTSSWCNVTINWSATGLDGTSVVTANFPELNTKVGSGDSGTATHAIPSYGATFYFKNHGTPVPSTQEITITPAHSNHQRFIIENCVIRAGNDTCLPHVQWLVENPYVEPMITATIDGKENTLITKGASGSVDDFNHTIQYSQNRTYYLYHDNVILDSKTITAVCAGDTEWNGTMCSPARLLFVNSRSLGTIGKCTIPIGSSSCQVEWKFEWLAKSPKIPVINPSIVDPQLSVTTPNSQHLYDVPFHDYDFVIPPASGYYTMSGLEPRYFFVYYGWEKVREAKAVATCEAGSAWNGYTCWPVTFSASDCVIDPNQSICNTNLQWTNVSSLQRPSYCDQISPPEACRQDYSYIKDENNTTVGNTSAEPTYNITHSRSYGIKTFNLFHRFVDNSSNTITGGKDWISKLGTATATATCTYGYTWDGNKCSIPPETFVVTPCEIPVYQVGQAAPSDSCQATLVWNVRNPKDSSSTGITFTTPSHTNNLPVVSDTSSGSTKFVLYKNYNTTVVLTHDGKQLASYGGAVAYCVAGTVWDTSTSPSHCASTAVPMGGTISATSCSIIDSTCQSTLSWNAWQKDEYGTTIPPVNQPTIEVYYNGIPMGTMNTTTTIAGNGGKKVIQVANGLHQTQFLFDTFNIPHPEDNYFGNGNNKGSYTLPYRDGEYYASLYHSYDTETNPVYHYINANGNQTYYRNATFKLVSDYRKVVTNNIYEQNLCLNLTGYGLSGSEPNYYCNYHTVLAETAVNAVCGYGYSWDDNANACIPTRTIGITLTKETLFNDTITTESVGTTPGQVTKTTNGVRALTTGLKTVESFTPNTTLHLIASLGVGFDFAKTTCFLTGENDKGAITPLYTRLTPNHLGNIYLDVTPSSTSTYSMVCTDNNY